MLASRLRYIGFLIRRVIEKNFRDDTFMVSYVYITL